MPFTSNLSELMRERKLTYEELQFRSKVAPDTIARVKDERIATVKLLTCLLYTSDAADEL